MKLRLIRLLVLIFGLVFLAFLASCQPAMQPTPAAVEEPVRTEAVEAPQPSAAPAVQPSQEAQPTQQPVPTGSPPTPEIEKRVIELEWPARLRLGESDVLRLALVPSTDGYTARAEFDEHPLATQDIAIKHPSGYSLYGIARLQGVGFEILPSGDQRRLVPPGEAVAWRWSLAAHKPGQQRLLVELDLRWEPEPGTAGPVGQSLAFGRSLDVQVVSFIGLTRFQTLAMGFFSLLMGGGLGLAVLTVRRSPVSTGIQTASPNRSLQLEHSPQIALSSPERDLIQALFARYQRVILQTEFFSGYSGARTFLAHPVEANGRSDAAAIIKIGSRAAMLQEYRNYETYVKDRLPPVTARIQRPPVSPVGSRLAAVQYTFIAEPGHPPLSLRQALQQGAGTAPLLRLFDTFGPNWWLQSHPYTFQVAQEYDRLLPPHWVLQPVEGGNARHTLGEDPPVSLQRGDVVRMGHFSLRELRPDGQSWSLAARVAAAPALLRVRWLSPTPPRNGQLARVTASRMDLLHEWTGEMDRCGLPDPLERLDVWLVSTLQGRRSTIHGDLNLENILVGPGDLVWLIDFASTREGHTQLDFAHLAAEIAAHILAPAAGSPAAFLDLLLQGDPLVQTVHQMARRCQFDPAGEREYRLAQALACLGALKYANLTPLAKNCLYLMAAWITKSLDEQL